MQILTISRKIRQSVTGVKRDILRKHCLRAQGTKRSVKVTKFTKGPISLSKNRATSELKSNIKDIA